MNYDSIYDKLITKAIVRKLYCPLTDYTENHHIIPRCINPELASQRKHPENLAVLTSEEHYQAHLLLVKMKRYRYHKNHSKLIYAANMMGHFNKKIPNWLSKLDKINKSDAQKKRYSALSSEEKLEYAKKRSGKNCPRYDFASYDWVHPELGLFFGSREELIKHFPECNLSLYKLRGVINGNNEETHKNKSSIEHIKK